MITYKRGASSSPANSYTLSTHMSLGFTWREEDLFPCCVKVGKSRFVLQQHLEKMFPVVLQLGSTT